MGHLKKFPSRKKKRKLTAALQNYHRRKNGGSDSKKTTHASQSTALCGRRIVSISELFEQIEELNTHSPIGCNFSNMKFMREKRVGLKSGFVFKCNMCNVEKVIWSEKTKPNVMDVNTCAVSGTMATGGGHAQLEEMLSAMDIPPMSNKTFKKKEDNISAELMVTAESEMKKAAAEEARLAVERGDVDKDGTPLLTVVADGSWCKRSYRTNYSSLSGVIFLLFFLLLYLSSFAIINSFRRQDKDDYYSVDEEEATVYRISLWLCTFALSVSVCAALLLPFSIVSNEVLLLYPTSYYVKWLNHSIIQGLWNHVFLFSNLSLFILIPFAYLFTESAGFTNNPKTLMSRVYETFLVLALLCAVVLGLTYIITALVDTEHSNIQLVLNIWSYHLPFLYSCISFLGVLLLLLCTPLGFARLFGVVGRLLVKPQFLQDLNEEFFIAQLEESCVRRRLEQASQTGKSYLNPVPMFTPQLYDEETSFMGLQNGELQAGLSERLTKVAMQRFSLGRQRNTSSIQRNIVYPVAMLILLSLTILTVLIVTLNTMELLIGIKALPLSTRQFTLGLSSLYKMGTVGAVLEIILILYLAVTSCIGLYSLPLIDRVSPKRGRTPLSHLIANSVLLLILSSALPLLARTLGITNFDLLGRFGQIEWLGNFSIVLLYNLVFAAAATLCLVTKFTGTVRRELLNRLQSMLGVCFKQSRQCPARVTVTPVHVAKQD